MKASRFRGFTDRSYEKAEKENYGKGTIVCNSWEEFNEAVKDIDCALVSPGGTGLPRSYVQKLEKDGLIRVFRVWVDSELEYYPSIIRFFYPSRDVCVFIPVDDIKRIKEVLNE